MTAAHKTLPMGSIVRVTNLVNGEQVMVKITDRGPFAHGRVLDLSEAAAKQIDLYRMGVAKVKVEAFTNPAASVAG
jgi:rare lipoprotein A